MERINFNHLYYFYVVAKEGSMRVASEKLFVTQPTISDQIKLLEEHFDCKLFDRRNRSLYLTKEGMMALEYAERIFELTKEANSRIKNKVALPKKTIDIGITHYMGQYFLYDQILPILNQQEFVIKIKESNRHLLLAELEEENIDIVFSNSKDSIASSMIAYPLGTNKTYVVAHKKFKKLKKTFPESLIEIPYFGYTDETSLKFEIELFFSQIGISPRLMGEADDADLLEVVTKNALAFTIVPEVTKNRFTLNKDVIVLGEIKELQTSTWGIIKKNYKGIGYKLLKNQI